LVEDTHNSPKISIFLQDSGRIAYKTIRGIAEFSGCLANCRLSSSASASSVFLVPTSNSFNLADGNIISFDVVIDFTDDSGTLGGGLDISFDSSAVSLFSLTRAPLGDPASSRDLDDLLESLAIGNFSPISPYQPEVIGSLEFVVLPTMGANTTVTIGAASGIAGPCVSGLDFVTFLNPDYNQDELSTSGTPPVFMDGFEEPPDHR
jgi:hypothetical protein